MDLRRWREAHPRAFLAIVTVAWVLVHRALAPTSARLVGWLPLALDGRLGESLRFFVYDTGCSNCRATIQLVDDLAKRMGVLITLGKVDQIPDIARDGIMATPGVVIDGTVVHAGGIPSRAKVESWFKAPAP